MTSTAWVGRAAVLLAACVTVDRTAWGETLPEIAPADVEFLDDLQHRTFDFFWETTNPKNGLVPDRWPSRSPSSIAAVGMGLSAYCVGVERGWVTRQAAVDRVRTTLRFLWEAPQNDSPTGASGYRGFFYHFLDMETGHRYRSCELSSVDTTHLMCGVLSAREYFDRGTPEETEIRDLADRLYRRVEWSWMQPRAPLIGMAWYPERGMGDSDYRGYDESMFLYALAIGSPTHPIDPAAWQAYASTYHWADFYGQQHVNFGPLMGHQYSHIWIDFRGVQDAFLRDKGIDYFENSRRATYAQQAYAADNPNGWKGYSSQVWGLAPCDGPANVQLPFEGEQRRFHTYYARGAEARRIEDDGTLAPTAAGGSIPFAPEITIPALRAMRDRYGDKLYGKYGFLDSFNPSFDFSEVEPEGGRVIPGEGWFDSDYLGLDQGPILLMAENYRTGLVWKIMRQNPYLRAGLQRAGLTGGWLDEGATQAPSSQH